MTAEDTRPNDYIRVSTSLLESPKLADVADENGPVTYAVWVHLLCQAKRARHLGKIIAPPVRVARAVGMKVSEAELVLESLEKHRCLIALDDRPWHYQIRNWTKWQSMTPAERTRKHRESKNVTNAVTVATETSTPETVSDNGGTQTKTKTKTKTTGTKKQAPKTPAVDVPEDNPHQWAIEVGEILEEVTTGNAEWWADKIAYDQSGDLFPRWAYRVAAEKFVTRAEQGPRITSPWPFYRKLVRNVARENPQMNQSPEKSFSQQIADAW